MKDSVIHYSEGLAGGFITSIISIIEDGVRIENIDGLDHKCDDYVKLNSDISYFLIISSTGTVIARSGAEKKEIDNYTYPEQIENNVTSKIININDDPILEVMVPINYKNNTIAAVVLGYKYRSINDLIISLYFKIFFFTLIFFVISVIVILKFLSKSIIEPLNTLSNSMKYVIKTGDYFHKISLKTNDEFGEITEIFNRLMKTINDRNMEIEAGAEEMEAQAEQLEAQNQELIRSNEELLELNNRLEISENKYRALVDNSIVGIFQSNIAGDFVFVNKKMVEMFGYDSEEDISINGIRALYNKPDDRDNFLEDLKKNEFNPGREVVMKKKTGTLIVVMVISRLIDNNIYGMMVDNTVRHEMQNELTIYKDYLNSIVQSISSIIIGVKGNGDIFFWNIQAEGFFSIKENEARDKKPWDICRNMEFLKEDFLNVTQSKSYKERQRYQYTYNGILYYLNIVTYPLITGEAGAVIRIDDVSLSIQLEQQLLQSQKMEILGTLSGGIAHDFNNILAGIVGSLSLYDIKTKNRGLNPMDLPEYRVIENIRVCSKRATDLINQLLSLSRKQDFNMKLVNLNEVVDDVIKICRNTFDKNIEIIIEPYNKTAAVMGDKTQLEQALLNLVINSRDSMTNGGTLRISVNAVEDDNSKKYRIEVSDTGIGIKEEDLDKVFTPFFTTKKEGRGTGLGLTMVKNIIRSHGGDVRLYSKEGSGTRVVITLSLTETKDINTKKDTYKQLEPGVETLLIIDDEYMIRSNFVTIFADLGYKVHTAKNGEEGIDIIKKNNDVAVVVLDLVMPGKNGLEVYREIKKINPNLKVILSSGYQNDIRITTLKEEGIDIFIEKPYKIEYLSRIIRRMLQKDDKTSGYEEKQ